MNKPTTKHINVVEKGIKILREEGVAEFSKSILGYIFRKNNKIFYRVKLFFVGGGIVDKFHWLYYDSEVWKKTYWLGIECVKCPLDLWVYQEIISDLKPDIIIETGTYKGGSALFLASICDLVGKGSIIAIDIKKQITPKHERIRYIIGSSTDKQIINKIQYLINNKENVMVIIDSDHSKEHVLKELKIYSEFVSVSSYLIVEDTNINGHPVHPNFGPGPMEAVDEFLRNNINFVRDKNKEKFFLSFNPRGFLRRVK